MKSEFGKLDAWPSMMACLSKLDSVYIWVDSGKIEFNRAKCSWERVDDLSVNVRISSCPD